MNSILLITHILGAFVAAGIVASSIYTVISTQRSRIAQHLTVLNISMLFQSMTGAGLMLFQSGDLSTTAYCVRGAAYFAIVGATYALLLSQRSDKYALTTAARTLTLSTSIFLLPLVM